MKRLGQAISTLGGVLVLAPLVVGLIQLTGGGGPGVVLDRAPTVVIAGLSCIVVGIALQQLG